MNVIDLFPKRKRVVGFSPVTGLRTANSLKKEKRWEAMMSDLWGCETPHAIARCSLYWSTVIEDEKWPAEWVTLARKEFDDAVKAVEALAAQQAE